jgi:hypothetical protein
LGDRSLTTHARADVAGCTIVAKSYLSYARVLSTSFRQQHPDIPFFTLLADEVDGYFDPAAEPFQLLQLTDLDIPDLERFRFHYTQQPLSYAATPYLLAHLLARGFQRTIFFKQESLVVGNLAPVFDLLERRSIVLTPHLHAPLTGSDRIGRELTILQSGTFNVGMLGVTRTEPASRFLEWWQDRLRTHCRYDVPGGMHYEQRWLDLVPGFFEDVHVLRDPGYNVAHWNLPDRAVTMCGDAILVEGQPCRLFRFSGYEPDRPVAITKYFDRLTWENVGPARAVFDRFRRELEDAGYQVTKRFPYAYGVFDNGVPVPDIARVLYVNLGDDVRMFGDPLRTASPSSYFNWLNQPVDDEWGSRTVTRLWHGIYRARPDLQAALPNPLGCDRDAFLNWTTMFGMREHGIPDQFVFADRPSPA